MKLFALPALALFTLMFAACTEPITEATKKVEANITGMTCSDCSSEVVAAVKGVKGVTACEADAKTGAVIVALDDDVDGGAAMLEVEKVIMGLSDGKYTVNTLTLSTDEVEELTSE